ncbi:hypothetical protein ACRPHP_15815 [Pantoea allii]|jgi:hypothetical protein|uniref:hypothetical protein n=1 Tax=Pantoea allii TaxID=574096 RepID=UPI0015608FEB|nr:hypothetical protein [Pantoea allii]NQS86759.1 hypothetical protein [Pantoea allii]
MTKREMPASALHAMCSEHRRWRTAGASVFISAHQFYNETQMRMAVDRHTGYVPQE